MTTETLQNNEKNIPRTPIELMDRLDSRQIQRLRAEIEEIHQQGVYDVEISRQTPDQAYNSPEKIENILEYLRLGDEILASVRRELLLRNMAWWSLDTLIPLRSKKLDKRIYDELEPLRKDLLYGKEHTDSEPWHNQRGRAAALLTIDEAHNLQINSDELTGQYPTMSGSIDDYDALVDHVFDGGAVAGMSLREAIIYTEREFSGKSSRRAEEHADKRLRQLKEFMEAPVTEEFKDVVQYCVDSLGIRERKVLVNQLILNHLKEDNLICKEIDDMTMMSFGCGTAKPVMEGMQRLLNETGQAPTLILLDQDPIALAIATQLAEKMGIADKVEVHCRRLFNRFGSPTDIKDILQGRELDVAEDSGLREYLPDSVYRKLTKAAWDNLSSGGLMVTGNMNANRPQPEFLHGLMGWYPRVQMRTIMDGFKLHEESGLGKGCTRAVLTPSGVYTVFVSEK